jgi:hypothetical protein
MNTTETISQALELKNWAVVGLGNNPDRPAFGVAKLLQDKGHQIFPVHPKAEMVHGATGYQSLFDIPTQIDVVDCFVNISCEVANVMSAYVDSASFTSTT